MGKFLRLIVNRLGIVLLISVVFLSATHQVLPSFEHTIPLAYPNALAATYPKLIYSTYFGGSEGSDRGYSLAVTEDGSCFVTGRTYSDDFPTQNAYDDTLGGLSDAFVTKFDDSPIPITRPLTVTGFLVFVAVMIFATLPVIALIVYKKQK